MFQFLKKNNQRNNNYPSFYPNPYQNMPTNNFAPLGPSPYDYNMMDMEMNELKRQISDLNQRINRLEGFLGVRDNQSNSNFS